MKPLDNIDCRKAVMYAMSPTSLPERLRRQVRRRRDRHAPCCRRRSPATRTFDVYGLKANPNGQVGQGQGRAEGVRPAGRLRDHHRLPLRRATKEKATAEAFQQSLGKVGIKLNVKPLPDDDLHLRATCGKPSYLVTNNLGLCVYGWGADWNDRLRLPVADRRQPDVNPRRVVRRTSRSASPRSTS